MMQKRLRKWKHKKSLVAVVLLMVMILSVIIPLLFKG